MSRRRAGARPQATGTRCGDRAVAAPAGGWKARDNEPKGVDHMGEKYYKPEIRKEEPLKLQQTGWAGDMPDGSAGGFISTDLEKDVVRQRISKDLYANPSSGIRELYANEARACRTAIGGGHGARISLKVDSHSRKIVLEGFGSSGMSWDTFANVFCVLGRSTNFDGRESGQFGFGRAAYMCISDIMILETHCRETGERYAVMGKAGEGFQTGLPTPDKGDFGTRVSLTAREDVDLGEIVRMVHDCARLSGVPTEIEITGSAATTEWGRELSGMVPAGDLETLALESLKSYDRRLFGSPDCGVLRRLHASTIDGDDIDVCITYSGTGAVGGDVTVAYLCGIPIQYDYVGKYRGHIGLLSVNVRDERKYKPTPDRERLSDEARERVDREIDSMITGFVSSIEKGSFEEYVMSPECRLIDGLIHGPVQDDLDGISEWDDYHRMLTCDAREPDSPNGSPWEIGLRLVAGKRRGILVTDSCRSAQIDPVLRRDPKIKVFKVDPDMIPLFESNGVMSVKSYMSANGIKSDRSSTSGKRNVRVYRIPRTYGDDGYWSFQLDDVRPGMVMARMDEITLVQDTGKHMRRGGAFPVDMVCANSVRGSGYSGIPFAEWRKSLGNYVYETSEGVMTVGQIIERAGGRPGKAPTVRHSDIPKGKVGHLVKSGVLVLYAAGIHAFPLVFAAGWAGQPPHLHLGDMLPKFARTPGVGEDGTDEPMVDSRMLGRYAFYHGLKSDTARRVIEEIHDGSGNGRDYSPWVIEEFDKRLCELGDGRG